MFVDIVMGFKHVSDDEEEEEEEEEMEMEDMQKEKEEEEEEEEDNRKKEICHSEHPLKTFVTGCINADRRKTSKKH